MTEYDDDRAKLIRAKQELRRKYLERTSSLNAGCDLPEGLVSGPGTLEELEEVIRELEADDQTEESDHER